MPEIVYIRSSPHAILVPKTALSRTIAQSSLDMYGIVRRAGQPIGSDRVENIDSCSYKPVPTTSRYDTEWDLNMQIAVRVYRVTRMPLDHSAVACHFTGGDCGHLHYFG